MQAKAKKNHKDFKKFGQKSLHILDSNIRNPRYPGFSQFTSSNALRNSSYCWTIGKDKRIKDKSYKKYNDNIQLGFGKKNLLFSSLKNGNPSPDAYNIRTIFDINIKHKKGIIFGEKFNYTKTDDKYKPGPGTYSVKNLKTFGIIPITLKSRHGFFYDDDLKKKKATVSMQKYKPMFNLVERNRFNGITFGIGDRPNMHVVNRFPGPGAYMVPGNFDRGYRGKLPLNQNINGF